MFTVPERIPLYHILHVDRLSSVIRDGALLSDTLMTAHPPAGTTIGMTEIKARRLTIKLTSRPGLHVGECVPCYFCPRSIMLFLFYKNNHPDLTYHGGQEPLIHLELDLHKVVAWAEANRKRWAFTLTNAGAYYFEDRADLTHLDEIDWEAVQATGWVHKKESKQAEFLLEERLPWTLIDRIGVYSMPYKRQVLSILEEGEHKPPVEIIPAWYY